ncbi:PREDICTED: F-box/kelch-repeat protein At3g23880-like [Lupinus angustifolius]|uniref:F-box/kelch-repeat protein At3g23880-like n=1 Tax=Lupinus angustifolius TaxID=3871 RepID=UPI00092E47CB|nr:PREDICTED: F-box/kelch-repeat protein At3g23880-like [Lupinus angustifolius]
MSTQATTNVSRKRRASKDDTTYPLCPVLLNELIYEILLWLPVKSLIQFKCVCKLWNSLISSSDFVKKHVDRSSIDPNLRNHRLLGIDYYLDHKFLLSPSLRSVIDDLSRPIFDESSFELCLGVEIVQSCNGLICWMNYENDNCVNYLNPSTKFKSQSPPCFDHPWVFGDVDELCFTLFGFGYDHINDTYKTIAIYCDPIGKKTMVKVYELGVSRSWRDMQSLQFFPCSNIDTYSEDYGKFVSGTLNWLCLSCDKSLVIVSLDITNETFEEISVPNVVTTLDYVGSTKLWVLGGCLCLSCDFNKAHFVLWQMKLYGVIESWNIFLKISYMDIGPYYPRPLFMWDNNEIMLKINDDGRFIVYNYRCNSLKHLEFWTSKIWIEGGTYIESLVSPYNASVN